MQRTTMKTNCTLAFLIAGMLAVGPARAEKPSWAGEGKGGKSEQGQKSTHEQRQQSKHEMSQQRDGDDRSPRDRGRREVGTREHFDDRHRTIAGDYYGEEFRRGRCPPGLAKKNNGCMPPGQARKWTVGQPLPREVIFHDLPPALAGRFDPLPVGYRYVRVANDILLIALGRGTVIDAIQNLGMM